MKTLLKVSLAALCLLYFGNGISLAGKHCSILNWGSCEGINNAHSQSSQHSQSTGGNTGGGDPGGSTGTPTGGEDHDDNGKGNGGEPGNGHGKSK